MIKKKINFSIFIDSFQINIFSLFLWLRLNLVIEINFWLI